MTDKFIRVPEKTHKKIEKIAEANYRGIGAQVSYWADRECPHPVEKREEFRVTLTIPVSENGETPQDNTLRVFRCGQCRQVVVLEGADEVAHKLDQVTA